MNATQNTLRTLTPRQQRFVDEFLVDLNATQAAIRAGYSRRTARSVGAENLTKPDIQAAIAAARAAQRERTALTADEVLVEYARVAFSDIADVFDFTGDTLKLRPASEITEDARRALASIKSRRVVEGTGDEAREVEIIEFKFWNKLDALGKLLAHLAPPAGPIRVDVTSGGNPIGQRDTLTVEDVVAAAELMRRAGLIPAIEAAAARGDGEG